MDGFGLNSKNRQLQLQNINLLARSHASPKHFPALIHIHKKPNSRKKQRRSSFSAVELLDWARQEISSVRINTLYAH
eukprot:scaffold7955_cov56-Skeletonema_dohrnii-CCMP3373.AAC.1